MILKDQDILRLIKDPAHGDERKRGGVLESKMKMHVTGEGYDPGIKDDSKQGKKIKDQLSKPATVEIMSIIKSDLSRWTNTQGTFKKYHFDNSEVEKNFKESLETVWKGKSLDYLMKKFHKEAMFTEFAGFYVVTKPSIEVVDGVKYSVREGIYTPFNGEDLVPYVIFICNEDVLDFYMSDSKVEYLIYKFKEEEDGKSKNVTYRVIDDARDSLWMCPNGNRTKTVFVEAMPNEVGECTVVPISTFNEDADDDLVKVSPVQHLLPLLDRYDIKDIGLVSLEQLHNYPKLATVRLECVICGHTGKITDPLTGTEFECPKCKGIGYVSNIDPDGLILLPQSIPNEVSTYPGSPASYVVPDVESLRYANDKLKELRDIIIYSGTGNKNLISTNIFSTATEVISNTRSLEDKVGEIIDSVEEVEEKLTYLIAKLSNTYRNIFQGSSIRYGRKLNIRDESVILEEIKQSKLAGMPESHINNLQIELISSRYRNSDEERERNLILTDIEPYCFLTVKEVFDMRDILNKDMLEIKLNFNELIDQFESEKGDISLFFENKDREKAVIEVREILKTYEVKEDDLQERGSGGVLGGGLQPDTGADQGTELITKRKI